MDTKRISKKTEKMDGRTYHFVEDVDGNILLITKKDYDLGIRRYGKLRYKILRAMKKFDGLLNFQYPILTLARKEKLHFGTVGRIWDTFERSGIIEYRKNRLKITQKGRRALQRYTALFQG